MSSNLYFNSDIPASGNNPSRDQPEMLKNNQSNETIWTVDHTGFNENNSGTHQQVTFLGTTTQSTPTGNTSIAFTKPGSASTVPELFYINNHYTTQLSAIKAWGTFDTNGSPLGTNQKLNIDLVSHFPTGTYTITISANAISSSFYGVLVTGRRFDSGSSSDRPIFATYSIQNATTLVLFFWNPSGSVLVDPTYFTVQIMQI